MKEVAPKTYKATLANASEPIKKLYLLLSVDNYSGWPDAIFLLPNPTAKVFEIPTENIAANGIPKHIPTDPDTVFISMTFKQHFC